MPTATPFNNLITFSRGSNATVTGSNGLIQWAPNNLLTNSESFDNAAWVKTVVTATANSTVAPNGTTTADTITASAGAGYHYAAQNAAVVAGTTYTASMYVRAGTARYIGFGDAGDAAWHSAYLDTTDGSILNQVNCVATAVSVGGGWFLVTNTFTRTNAANAQIYVGGSTVTGNAGPVFTAAGTETCIAWGAQLELGSTATTYNPTTVKNLLGFSEAFDNAAWTKTRASIVTGAQANPINGLFNAQKLMEDTTATNSHFVSQAFTAVSTTTPYTFSVYAKAAGRTILWLFHANATSISFDLANGTCDVGGVITNVGSGWYRCSVTANAPDLLSRSYSYRLGAPSASYTGDGNSGVYIYGAQLSDSASLDPYVPTPGAAPSSTAFYGPRFDFDPVTLQPRGLLVEEQRTNLLTYSDQLNDGVWTKSQTTVTANSTTSPDGTANADTLSATASGVAWRQTYQIGKTLTAIPYAWSVYAKAKELNWLVINAFDGSNRATYFNLANGTVGTVAAGDTASIQNVGNGWYRCIVTRTAAATANGGLSIELTTGDNIAPTTANLTAGQGIFFYGAQLEAGAFATSYIPTVASTVTRSADVATITGQNFAQWYRQPEGTLVAEFSGPSGGYPLNMTDGTTNNATGIVYVGATTLRGISVVSGAGRFVDMAASAAPAVNKTSYGYRLNDLGGSTNNGAVVANTTAPIPVLDRMFVGTFSNFSFLNGHIRNIRFIPARAADFQLQAL